MATSFPSVHEQPKVGEREIEHAFNVEDLLLSKRIGDPVASPDGKLIAFPVRSWDPVTNKWTGSIYLAASDGSTPATRLTYCNEKTDDHPCWSQDGSTLFFISNRSGKRQIHFIAVNGGESSQLTSFPLDVDSMRLSPDSSAICFQAQVFPLDVDDVIGKTAEMLKAKETNPTEPTGLVYSRLMVRHWDTEFDGRRSHLFVQSIKRVADGWVLDGGVHDMLRGLDTDAPPRPFGGIDGYCWHPNGEEIAYAARPPVQPTQYSEALMTTVLIYRVQCDDGVSSTICVNPRCKATSGNPVFSPSGAQLAFLEMQRPGYESDRPHIIVLDLTDQAPPVDTSSEFDRPIGSMSFDCKDETVLYVTAGESARTKLFRTVVGSQQFTPILESGTVSGVVVTPTAIVYGYDTLQNPREIFACDLDGKNIKQLTHFNDGWLSRVQLSSPQDMWCVGSGGDRVHSWFLPPVGYQEGRQYPLCVLIHGGPQGAWDDHFHYRWNPQLYAAAGYAVLAVNPHGSTGFGQAYTDAVCRNWGGAPYEDIMMALDNALQTYSWIDSSRVAALGASYGGYMINWINGHTNRFKCMVCHNGIFSLKTAYYTTDEMWFPEWEFGGQPTDAGTCYDQWDPSAHVAKWQTPTLIIHSRKDYRVCETDGIAAFTALQRRGVRSKLLYFPDENHWVLQPRNSRLWHDTVFAWLSEYLADTK